MAVKKWEDFKDKPTNMDINIEIMLRLHIYNHISIHTKNDKIFKLDFYEQFIALKDIFFVRNI